MATLNMEANVNDPNDPLPDIAPSTASTPYEQAQEDKAKAQALDKDTEPLNPVGASNMKPSNVIKVDFASAKPVTPQIDFASAKPVTPQIDFASAKPVTQQEQPEESFGTKIGRSIRETPGSIADTVKKEYGEDAKAVVGVGEEALSTLSGILANPIADVTAYMAQLFDPDLTSKQMASGAEEFAGKMTYQPQTQAGQQLHHAVSTVLEPTIGKVFNFVHDVVQGITNDPMVAKDVTDALGLYMAKGTPKVPEAVVKGAGKAGEAATAVKEAYKAGGTPTETVAQTAAQTAIEKQRDMSNMFPVRERGEVVSPADSTKKIYEGLDSVFQNEQSKVHPKTEENPTEHPETLNKKPTYYGITQAGGRVTGFEKIPEEQFIKKGIFGEPGKGVGKSEKEVGQIVDDLKTGAVKGNQAALDGLQELHEQTFEHTKSYLDLENGVVDLQRFTRDRGKIATILGNSYANFLDELLTKAKQAQQDYNLKTGRAARSIPAKELIPDMLKGIVTKHKVRAMISGLIGLAEGAASGSIVSGVLTAASLYAAKGIGGFFWNSIRNAIRNRNIAKRFDTPQDEQMLKENWVKQWFDLKDKVEAEQGQSIDQLMAKINRTGNKPQTMAAPIEQQPISVNVATKPTTVNPVVSQPKSVEPTAFKPESVKKAAKPVAATPAPVPTTAPIVEPFNPEAVKATKAKSAKGAAQKATKAAAKTKTGKEELSKSKPLTEKTFTGKFSDILNKPGVQVMLEYAAQQKAGIVKLPQKTHNMKPYTKGLTEEEKPIFAKKVNDIVEKRIAELEKETPTPAAATPAPAPAPAPTTAPIVEPFKPKAVTTPKPAITETTESEGSSDVDNILEKIRARRQQEAREEPKPIKKTRKKKEE